MTTDLLDHQIFAHCAGVAQEEPSIKHLKKADRNQFDGCQAGVRLSQGHHRMGREGGYPDLMRCTAKLYEINPTVEDCSPFH